MRRWTQYQLAGATLVRRSAVGRVLRAVSRPRGPSPRGRRPPRRRALGARRVAGRPGAEREQPAGVSRGGRERDGRRRAAQLAIRLPVGPEQLSRLTLTYWGFDARAHEGTLIVHRSVAQGLITVFQTLYRDRFPIRLLEPVDAYDGSDDASMAADNTSAFNCRKAVAAGTPSWSEHAYGKAIDVNPVENPYVFGREVLPPAGAAHLDRAPRRSPATRWPAGRW
jgi:hypothetical protein